MIKEDSKSEFEIQEDYKNALVSCNTRSCDPTCCALRHCIDIRQSSPKIPHNGRPS